MYSLKLKPPLLITFSSLCLLAQPTFSASTLYSSVNTTGSASESSALLTQSIANRTSSTSVFNLSISLEEDPQGDDVYPADSGTGDDAQNKFEAKIEEFADAVFQATNGAHKIGKVTVFRDGNLATLADVQWKKDCARKKGPRASPSGFGVPGRRIYFCTTWPGASTLMDTPKGAGFTLAHEWGHYTYGLYDEYVSNCGKTDQTQCADWKPRSTDTASSPSIMHNQWNAARAGGDQDWLEFSTNSVEPFTTKTATKDFEPNSGFDRNAQSSVFGENGWVTLTRDSASDPTHSFLPQRTTYSNLAAPPATDQTVNDDESTARSELKIVWAGNQVVELMIDTSGSMAGSPLSSAKTAAGLLVDQLAPGATAVGVGRFSSSASQAAAITDIPDPDTGVRTAAKAAINGFSAGGGTNIEGAALFSLNQTQSFQSGARPSVVFLLTDGRSTVNVTNVTTAYKAAGVPLMTFGFGGNVDTALLQGLASGTGGQYFFSPTSLAKIQQAFVAATSTVTSNVLLISEEKVSAANATEVRPVQVDSSMKSATVNITYPLNEADLTLRLLDAAGNDTGLTFVCNSSTEVSCNVDIDTAANPAGTYGIEIVNNTAQDKSVALLASGKPSDFESYDIAVEFNNANYPADLAILATVSKGAALTGLDVTAEVTRPDGSVVEFTLLDDGMDSDREADDGTYSVTIPYSGAANTAGTYTAVVKASNAAGLARTTYTGVAISVDEDGNGVLPEQESITENFIRTAVSNAAVTGVATDDHGNDPTQPASCVKIVADNTDTLGRIDSAGDVDCFTFVPDSTTHDLIVRFTDLTQELDPIVRVYDSTGTTEQLVVRLSDSENAASGVVRTIAAALLDPMGYVVTIEHSDATKAAGGYAFSVGKKLTSDVKNTVTGGGDPMGEAGDGGSGSLSWLFILSGLLLSVFRLRQRKQ